MVLATGAHAVGFGRVPASVALGSSLDLSIPVRLLPDEAFTAACVAVEVQHGDSRWHGNDLAVAVDPGATPNDRTLRIRSRQVVNEPVIAISITAGCGSPVTRRFTAFVDPPEFARGAAVADLGAPPAPPAVLPLAGAASEVTSTGVAPAAPMSTRPLAPRSAGVARSQRSTRVAASGDAPVRSANRPAPVVRAAAAAPAPRPTLAPLPRLPAGISRLRLEDDTPEFFPTAASGVMGAGRPLLPFLADMAAAADAAASATERVKTLEVSLQQLKADSLAQREQINQMRSKVADAESINRLAPWLGAALAIMAALALWFGWRLRSLQKMQQAQWWASAMPAEGSAEAAAAAAATAATAEPPVAAVVPEPAAAPAPAPRMPVLPSKPPAPVVPLAKVAPPAPDATVVIEHAAPVEAEAPPQRAMAIEELLDLEQQAEFFVVLGQEEAAVELLTGHIRNTGGSSPLPYLKLLELFRRSGDRDHYERTRERFNLRFNAYAPDWEQDLREGKSLEHYPDVLMRLEAAWAHPLDAMAELEALLFRRDDGEMFHLPAYRELLFLYSVVRDVFDHQESRPEAVDVLLPLAQAGGDGSVSDFIVASDDRAVVVDTDFELPDAGGAGKAAVDLDLDVTAPEEPAVVRVDDGPSNLSFTLDPPPADPNRRR